MLVHILLIDDNPEFLSSAARFLSAYTQFLVVGCIPSGQDGLHQAAQLQPDLVLVDMVMPEMGGLEVTRQLKARPNAPRVVVLTLYDNSEYRAAAAEAGADGFVPKSEFGTQLQPLICSLFDDSQAVGRSESAAASGEDGHAKRIL